MSLIKFENFRGSKIVEGVIVGLGQSDLLEVLGLLGYKFDMTPLMETTDPGMIEDSPNKHLVTIKRMEHIGPIPTPYDVHRKIYEAPDAKQKCFMEMYRTDIKYASPDVPATETTDAFTVAASRDILCFENTMSAWYRHAIEFIVTRRQGESDEKYIQRTINSMMQFVSGIDISVYTVSRDKYVDTGKKNNTEII